MKTGEVNRQALESLATKVRVALIAATLPGISLSNDSNRWGKTNRYKPLFPEECRELAAVLILAAEQAEKNLADRASGQEEATP